jgi:hypothetical protein
MDVWLRAGAEIRWLGSKTDCLAKAQRPPRKPEQFFMLFRSPKLAATDRSRDLSLDR